VPTAISTPDAVKLELLIRSLNRGQTVCISALGQSMLPAIWPKDLLVIERVECGRLALGKIVLRRIGEQLQVHRLVGKLSESANVGASNWITKGDSNPHPDIDAFAEEDILGVVVAIQRYRRSTSLKRRSGLRRLASFALRASPLLRNTALRLHYWRHARSIQSPTEHAAAIAS
jgi:signal peptidase